jgi:hypothetical protein
MFEYIEQAEYRERRMEGKIEGKILASKQYTTLKALPGS